MERTTSSPIGFTLAMAAVMVLLACMRAFAADGPGAASVREAIARGVVAELGGGAEVEIEALLTTVADAPGLRAIAEPGARTGSAARFTIWTGRRRAGTATATVRARARHARAARPIGRHEQVAAADVVDVHDELRDVPIKRLPSPEDVVGMRPRRQIAAGEPLTAVVVAVPHAVRSGDEVTATVVVDVVRVSGRAIASGSGHVGDVIRIIRTGRRRSIRARVTAPGEVEVLR